MEHDADRPITDETKQDIDYDRTAVLDDRLFFKDENPLLFHYCSPSTLLLILSNRSFRYSDLTRLNDAEERIWGRENVFFECLARLEAGRGVPVSFPDITVEQIHKLRQSWAEVEEQAQPFACCFSLDGDSLSQWRAYSVDGEGFAVGIRRKQISSRSPAQSLKVCYSPEGQIEEMFSALDFIIRSKTLDDVSRKENESPFDMQMLDLVIRSVAFKNPAFRDECEVRSVYTVFVDGERDQRHFAATGGYALGQVVERKLASFEARGTKIVPYVDWSFGLEDEYPIERVHLGPKCQNTIQEVEVMLRTMGYKDTIVDKAGAHYR